MDKESNRYRHWMFKQVWIDAGLFDTDEFIEKQRLKRKRRKQLKLKVRDLIYPQLPNEWTHLKKLIVSGKAACLSIKSPFIFDQMRASRVEIREYENELYTRLSKMLEASNLLLENIREMPAILFELFDQNKQNVGLKVEDCYYTLEILSSLLKDSGCIKKPDSKKLPQGNTPTLKGVHDLIVGNFMCSRELGRQQIAQILVSLRSSLTEADIALAYRGLETVANLNLELNATYQRLRNAGI